MTTCKNISCNFSIETPLNKYTHTIYTENNKVYAIDNSNNKGIISGTLNQVLSSTAKSGNSILIKNGNYNLTTFKPPANIKIKGESENTVINASDVPYLIYLKSNSSISNLTFEHTGRTKTIYVSGQQTNWKVDNNYFIDSDIAVIVENLTSSNKPTSGYGQITNNKGLHSKLSTLQGTVHNLLSGNKFYDKTGSEIIDFNYNTHYNVVENNEFINKQGYSLDQEVIDMVGGNSFTNSNNIVRNNKIVGNFQTAIRPAKSAVNNTITDNYIEFKSGNTQNIAAIYLYGDGGFSTPKGNKINNNTIIGGKVGIELSGSETNEIKNNNISNTIKGISLVKKSSSGYGSSISPKNNTISKNIIHNIDYGIYTKSSPNNTITKDNIITNYRIKDIYNA
jgi:parallel beta-helix repeat protein